MTDKNENVIITTSSKRIIATTFKKDKNNDNCKTNSMVRNTVAIRCQGLQQPPSWASHHGSLASKATRQDLTTLDEVLERLARIPFGKTGEWTPQRPLASDLHSSEPVMSTEQRQSSHGTVNSVKPGNDAAMRDHFPKLGPPPCR